MIHHTSLFQIWFCLLFLNNVDCFCMLESELNIKRYIGNILIVEN